MKSLEHRLSIGPLPSHKLRSIKTAFYLSVHVVEADKMDEGDGSGIDALDAFMASIKKGGMDTKTKMALKKEMFELRTEQQKLIKLVNIAKPPNLPPLPS